jgi:hypothetical protein
MKRWLGPVLVMLAVAAAAHAAALHFAPSLIMSRAMAALAERGVALHRFTQPARITPQTQQVVRCAGPAKQSASRYSRPAARPRKAQSSAPQPKA